MNFSTAAVQLSSHWLQSNVYSVAVIQYRLYAFLDCLALCIIFVLSAKAVVHYRLYAVFYSSRKIHLRSGLFHKQALCPMRQLQQSSFDCPDSCVCPYCSVWLFMGISLRARGLLLLRSSSLERCHYSSPQMWPHVGLIFQMWKQSSITPSLSPLRTTCIGLAGLDVLAKQVRVCMYVRSASKHVSCTTVENVQS